MEKMFYTLQEEKVHQLYSTVFGLFLLRVVLLNCLLPHGALMATIRPMERN
jgi:hypothetical protein